jgi:chromosome segregation ATPase
MERYMDDRSGIDYDRIDSRALQELKSREAEMKKQIRDVEKAIEKISENERYLEGRLNSVRRTVARHCRTSDALYKEAIEAARSSEHMIQAQLETLAEERELFVRLLERCKCEAATLKVKIDLFGISAEQWAWKTFGDAKGRGPIDELGDEDKERYVVLYR